MCSKPLLTPICLHRIGQPGLSVLTQAETYVVATVQYKLGRRCHQRLALERHGMAWHLRVVYLLSLAASLPSKQGVAGEA